MLSEPSPLLIRGAQLIGALSHALDLTEGQPVGHCLRVCWMGMKLGEAINMPRHELSDFYYTLLLKDLGCSSNAARICELYLVDDRKFKADFKTIDGSLSQALRFVLSHTGLESSMVDRFRAIVNIMKNGGEISRDLIEARCHRGADIAREMGISSDVAEVIENLDENWDGSGKPEGKVRRNIPAASQLALLAQVVDIFFIGQGRDAAIKEVMSRSGTWFDSDLVEVFLAISSLDEFWEPLKQHDLAQHILALEPEEHVRLADEDYMDRVAKGFAMVVDSKSPFTAGHSERVALFADMIAEKLGYGSIRCRWVRRAGLLQDLGKLAISNEILDKPAKLTAAEFEIIKTHSRISGEILSTIPAFRDIVAVASGHHERLDGEGYPFGLSGNEIFLDTRIITIADVFDALTADRPYRKAQSVDQALFIISKELGKAFDKRCFDALNAALREANLNAA